MHPSKKRRHQSPSDDETNSERKNKKNRENIDNDDIGEEEVEHIESNLDDSINWPENDIKTLITNMEQSLPEKDVFAFQTRAEKLNWNNIAFGKYSGDDCKKTWLLIQKRLRRFRLLSELLQDAKEWISKPWTNFYKGSKNNRHPDLPKRPLSVYMLFYVRKKGKVLAEFPGLGMTELSKKISLMYKDLSVKKQEKYEQLALAERNAYKEKMEEFYRNHPEVPRPNQKTSDSRVAKSRSNKPLTPFSLFYNDQLQQFYSESKIDRPTFKEQCKEEWKSMTDQRKSVWIDLSLEQEKKYQEELKDNPNYSGAPHKSVLSKEEKAIKERLAGKPSKPPSSAYSLFAQIMLRSDEIKKIDFKERMKTVADHWKSSTDEEKKLYQEQYEQLTSEYKLNYAAYVQTLSESKREKELESNNSKKKIKTNKETDNKTKPNTHKKKNKTVEKSDEPSHSNETEQVEGIIETENKTKERKPKKKKKNLDESAAPSQLDDSNIFNMEPVQPPVSGFALFNQRYHGKAPVETLWKSLSKEEKNEFKVEVDRLKRKYMEDYELFLESLTKEQLSVFCEIRKAKEQQRQKENID